MREKQIGIALSGGVDSTACALLLREHYPVKGFFMQLAQPNYEAQKAQVEAVAKKLGISLQIFNLQREFEQKVLDYFSGSYFQGLTPNPCVICNKEIKFGLFLEAILSAGMDVMATGHYARIEQKDDTFHLHCGDDPKKDQSYFLSRLSQEQLAKVIFPLGDKTKQNTYHFVEEHGFNDFHGKESQDVCFLENSQIGNFLEVRSQSADVSGSIVSTSGKVLGRHKGLFRYTIGQRKGLGISSDTPLYVVGLDATTNLVIVGKNEELFRKQIRVEKLHWLADKTPDVTIDYTVRIRYSHRGSMARISLDEHGGGDIIFHEPQRAVTPGQFAVIYHNTELLGSGIIL
ncbi:MAG: tRNA 2-thiouridine(34) synthase MnmA [Desulfobulbaceae bacterium]|nr:tRNA 2-thiouridine(34) synthase MnmA [Desulfobulbaceae bacterium]